MPRGGAGTPTLRELIEALPELRAAGVRRAKVGAIEIEFGAAPVTHAIPLARAANAATPPDDGKAERREWEKIAYMSSDAPAGSIPPTAPKAS